MCFSATASFIAGGVLTVAGVASISQVRKPQFYVFACMPLLFAVQQICEGFVWLSLSTTEFSGFHNVFKYAFLFFAQVVWPFFIPYAFYRMEPIFKRKDILRYFVVAGAIVSVVFAYRLIFSDYVAEIDGCHISYEIESSMALRIFAGILYMAAIVIAPFFSSIRGTIYLASANVISLVITHFFFEVYLVSVWCFFAAAQSIIVFFILRNANQNKRKLT